MKLKESNSDEAKRGKVTVQTPAKDDDVISTKIPERRRFRLVALRTDECKYSVRKPLPNSQCLVTGWGLNCKLERKKIFNISTKF